MYLTYLFVFQDAASDDETVFTDIEQSEAPSEQVLPEDILPIDPNKARRLNNYLINHYSREIVKVSNYNFNFNLNIM